MITIQPSGGLCNRMRALDSAISLSKKINKPLILAWCKDRGMNCRYDELFIIPKSIIKVKEYNRYYDSTNRITRFYHKYFSQIINELPSLYFEKFFTDKKISELIKKGYNFENLAFCKTVFIVSGRRFYNSTFPFKEFTPVESIQKIIDSYTNSFNSTIGVHIRRTDNFKAIQSSPTEKFISLMEKEVSNDRNVSFFLATDSKDEEFLLKARFPDRIIIHPKENLSRTNPRAIQDALIDLFCLSKCKKLIGSFHSSFTDTAWQINNIERVIARQDNCADMLSVW